MTTPWPHKNTPTLIVRFTEIPMKSLFLTVIATMWLTDAAHAGGWTSFHGDIGLSSPFASSSPPANNATTKVVPKRQAVTKQKATSNRSVAGHKFKPADHRITTQ
jgi:hypothetical protein